MLRTLARWWRVSLGVAAILAMFVWAVVSSYEFQACVETSQNQNAAQSQESFGIIARPLQWADNRYNCLGFWFSGNKDSLSALSSILLTVITFGLVWTAIRQEHTTRAQLRAYVSATPNFVTSFDETHWTSARYTIQNIGPTPAFGMQHLGKVAALPQNLPAHFELPEIRSTYTEPLVLFPGMQVIGNSAGTLFTSDELAGIRNKSLKIYIYGTVKYRDTFGREHLTTFCSDLNPPDDVLAKLAANSTEVFSNLNYRISPIGNDAT